MLSRFDIAFIPRTSCSRNFFKNECRFWSVLLLIYNFLKEVLLSTGYFSVQPGKKRVINFLWLTWASQVALVVRNLAANAADIRDIGLIPGSGRCLKVGRATYCSFLDWRIPWTKEPIGLWSTGSHRVRHNWRDLVQHTWTECQLTISQGEGSNLFNLTTHNILNGNLVSQFCMKYVLNKLCMKYVLNMQNDLDSQVF